MFFRKRFKQIDSDHSELSCKIVRLSMDTALLKHTVKELQKDVRILREELELLKTHLKVSVYIEPDRPSRRRLSVQRNHKAMGESE